MYRCLVAVTFVALPALADDKKPAESPLKGKWEVTAAKFNGSEMATLKGRTLVFDETEFSTYDGETRGSTLAYTLNPKADPKKIDVEQGAGGKKALGIYKVDKDELTICYAEPDADRPRAVAELAADLERAGADPAQARATVAWLLKYGLLRPVN